MYNRRHPANICVLLQLSLCSPLKRKGKKITANRSSHAHLWDPNIRARPHLLVFLDLLRRRKVYLKVLALAGNPAKDTHSMGLLVALKNAQHVLPYLVGLLAGV